MLDIKYIRENAEAVKKNVIERGVDSSKADTDLLLKIDSEKNALNKQIDDKRARRNELANEFKKNNTKPSPELIEEGKKLKEEIASLEKEVEEKNAKWKELMLWFPNLSSEEMPDGKTSEDNVEVKAWRPDTGYLSQDKLGKGEFSAQFMPTKVLHSKDEFEPKEHLELGTNLGIIDVEQSAKVSGSRFCYLLGDAVRLQLALQFMMSNKLMGEGFTPVIPPLLVKEDALYGSSHFPGDADQVYSINNDKVEDNNKLYLVGSSEPANFAYLMGRTLEEEKLPFKMFATTACFRSEVGSWGKDVKGIKRVHQFDKLEMDLVCSEEDSKKMHEYLLSLNEWLLQELKLPYHIINMCKGDAGYYATYKKYDIEVWLPGQKKYIEVGSNTNAIDYQARRYNTTYKTKDGQRKFVHNVNDTGIPFGRMLICILENYQQKDVSILVPEVLRSFVGKDVISK
ncbi:MAG: serine--tRNA ligase [bacterium]